MMCRKAPRAWGCPVIQTPASVEIVTQRTIQEQGYRTTTDTAQGAVGVLSGDSGGAPAIFSMRGLQRQRGQHPLQRNLDRPGRHHLAHHGYGQSRAGRIPEGSVLDHVGPGRDRRRRQLRQQAADQRARQERNRCRVDSLGTYRTHLGSGGSTTVQGLDYRFDAVGSKLNSFIDGDFRDLADLSAQLNYRVTDDFKVFAAFEYKNDYGHAYWGTPLVPVSFAGSHAVSGVVSGTAVNTFDGSIIGPLTIDSRTLPPTTTSPTMRPALTTFGCAAVSRGRRSANVTVKDQYYSYQAKRSWFDSETYAFNNATSTIDRDRFFVTHNQQVIGNNADLTWDSRFLGMDNRFAAQLQVSSNWITFEQEGNPDAFPGRHRFRHQSLARRVRPGISQYAEQPAHRHRWIIRGSAQDHAGLCADRRGPRWSN